MAGLTLTFQRILPSKSTSGNVNGCMTKSVQYKYYTNTVSFISSICIIRFELHISSNNLYQ